MKIKPNWDRPVKPRYTRKFTKVRENVFVQYGGMSRQEARAYTQAKRKEYIKSRKKQRNQK